MMGDLYEQGKIYMLRQRRIRTDCMRYPGNSAAGDGHSAADRRWLPGYLPGSAVGGQQDGSIKCNRQGTGEEKYFSGNSL